MSQFTPFADRLCQTLFHSLWQGAVIVIVASIFVRLSRRDARIGYATWMTGLVATVACLPLTFSIVSSAVPPRPADQFNPVRVAVPERSTQIDIAVIAPSHASLQNSVTPQVSGRSTPVQKSIPTSVDSDVSLHRNEEQVKAVSTVTSAMQIVAPFIAAMYALGVGLMLFRLCRSALCADQLVHGAAIQHDSRLTQIIESVSRRWNMRVAPVVAVSQRVLAPHVVGFIQPVILLPTSAMTGLSVDVLTLILIHEIAHLRRFDLWAAMMQRIIESILFFNPAVWYLSRRASEYREFCCDELVCRDSADSTSSVEVRYADALLQVVLLSAPHGTDSQNLTALAASGRSPSELRRRIARLLNEPIAELFPGGRRLLMTLGAGLLCLTLPVMWPSNVIRGRNPQAILAVEDHLDAQKTFRLQVKGPDGKPVPDLECEIRGIPAIPATDVLEGKHIRNARYGTILATNTSGQLDFRQPSNINGMEIFVQSPGYSPYVARWQTAEGSNAIPDSFTIELQRAWTVIGQVVDEAGKPIQNVEISPSIKFQSRPGDKRRLGVGARLTTDANGVWSYEMVPETNLELHVAVSHPDYAPNRTQLKRTDYELKTDLAPKTIVLSRGLSVTGTVKDENGNPVEGALVRTKYMNEIREARTDKAGAYTIRGCEPKLSRIVCSAAGRARELQTALIDPAMAPVNFTMVPGRHVRIRVLDEEGNGVPGSRIFFQQWRGHVDYFEFDGVNQYTDNEGVWEWNEAPVDEFHADICRKDGMMLPYKPIVQRNEEYVFQPPRRLVISGRVTDQATGQPVKNFRCVPGGRDEPRRHAGDTWHLHETFNSSDGTFKITRNSAVPAHLIRIEAEGYKVAVSRDVQNEEGDVELNFELTRAPDIFIKIETPLNEPAVAADVAVALADEQIVIDNGEFTTQTYTTLLKTDESGILKMPFRDKPFEIYILHPTGFAQINPVNGNVPDRVTLTAWATVKGKIYSGNHPAPNLRISCWSDGGFQSQHCRVLCRSIVQSGEDGVFSMHVFPGTGRIRREMIYMVKDGFTEVTSSQNLPATFRAGETTRKVLGRGGRPVAGRLVPPPDFVGQIAWGTLEVMLEPDLPQPIPRGLDENDPQSIVKWQTSPEARDYAQKLAEWKSQMAELPTYSASVDRDGSFRINNVLSGKYVLSQGFGREPLKVTISPQKLEIPEIDSDTDDTPLDLGEIQLR